ncbi:MAG: DUF3667 domain-containing protein, partial [Bacteroidia bacterium]|nr:DUF3667 domain-containing protein [Bacteroidia bacterium]
IIPLLFKPGFLTKEFLGGRRQRYLEPIRMYVFLSFLCFFIIGIVHKIGTSNEKHSSKLTTHAPVNSSDDLKYKVKWVNLNLSPINPYIKDNATIAGYDSLQSALPSNEKDGIIELQISRMMINYNLARRTQGDDKANENIYKNTLSTIPKVFFILLPLFGLLLKIVFVRRNIYFINHAIFTIHFHCFLFLLFCILYPISTFSPWVSVLQLLLPLVYLYVAMLNVYKQTKIKTFFKFSFLTFTYGFFLLVALLFSIGYSAFTLA